MMMVIDGSQEGDEIGLAGIHPEVNRDRTIAYSPVDTLELVSVSPFLQKSYSLDEEGSHDLSPEHSGDVLRSQVVCAPKDPLGVVTDEGDDHVVDCRSLRRVSLCISIQCQSF